MTTELRHQPLLDLAKRVNGRQGAAHLDPREAYREVPILIRPTWNREVAAYFYCGGISSGAAVLGAVAALAGGPRLRPVDATADAVAFAALLPCAPLLIADLGVPQRFHHMLRIFKPSSPMNLGAWTLTVHGAVTTLRALRLAATAGRLPFGGGALRAVPGRALATAGLPAALTLGGYTGVLLGTTSVPVWAGSPLLGALFTASSLSNGAAAVSLVLAARNAPGAVRDALTPLNAALGGAELALLGGYIATAGPGGRSLRRGPAGLLLAGATAAATAAVALELGSHLFPRRRRLLGGLAAALTLLGGAALRAAVLQAGHDSAADRESTLAATRPSRTAPGWGVSTDGR